MILRKKSSYKYRSKNRRSKSHIIAVVVVLLTFGCLHFKKNNSDEIDNNEVQNQSAQSSMDESVVESEEDEIAANEIETNNTLSYSSNVNSELILMTHTLADYSGKKERDVREALERAGFFNFYPTPVNDLLVQNSDKHLCVTNLTINGEHPKANQKYPKNSKINIEFHKVNEEIKGLQPFDNASEYVGKDYSFVRRKLEEAGFTNIDVIPLKDLSMDAAYDEGIVGSISIDGKKHFNYFDTFGEESRVIISYHSLAPDIITIGRKSSWYHGKTFDRVFRELSNQGFKNFRYVQLSSDFISKGRVENINIGGSTEFEKKDQFYSDEEVVIQLHVEDEEFKKIIRDYQSRYKFLPVSTVDMIGLDRQEAFQQLKDAGFENVFLTERNDLDEADLSLKDTVAKATVDGDDDVEKGKMLPVSSTIRLIYHAPKITFSETEDDPMVSVNFSQDDFVGKNEIEVIGILKGMGFSNITSKPISPEEGDTVVNGQVAKVLFNGEVEIAKYPYIYKGTIIEIEYYYIETDTPIIE